MTLQKIHTNPTEALFGGYHRRILALLLMHPDQSYHVREIARMTEVPAGSLHRELKLFSESGILLREPAGNQVRYRANRECPIFPELAGILRKTVGLADVLREALAPLTKCIQAAFVYGSIAKGTATAGSDVDVMIISDDITYPDVMQVLTKVEGKIGRTINPTVYGSAEWRRKAAEHGGFLQRVMEQPRIYLIGTDDDLPKQKSRKSGKDR